MKRATVWLLAAFCLAGCAPFRAAASPGQVLSVALQATSGLKTAHADYTRALTYDLPVDYPWPPATLGMPPHTLRLDLSGTGDVAFPDRFHYLVTDRMGPSFHFGGELISIKGVAYEQDGVHVDFGGTVMPTWSKRTSAQNWLPVDPFLTLQSLRDTLTPRDLGDTTLGGIRVHHYAIDMDKTNLIAKETSALTDPSLRPALEAAIQQGTLDVEVWIGLDDHLIRRISSDETRRVTIALLNAEGNLAKQPGASNQGMVTMSDQTVLNLNHFNSAVTITVPANVR